MQIPRTTPNISCFRFAATYFCTGTNSDGRNCLVGSSKSGAGVSAVTELSRLPKSVECSGRPLETNADNAANLPLPDLSGLHSAAVLRTDAAAAACRRGDSV